MTRRPLATRKQRRYLQDLAARAGVEMPRVVWAAEASDAIRRLERYLATKDQLRLEGVL